MAIIINKVKLNESDLYQIKFGLILSHLFNILVDQ